MNVPMRRSVATIAVPFAVRALLFAVLAWVLAEGKPHAPMVIALGALAAAGASLVLQPAGTLRMRALPALRLGAYFLYESVLGAMDVARRALAPALPLKPGLLRFELEITGFPAVLFTWLVSLMPGTAAAGLHGSVLTLHALDVTLKTEGKLRHLEHHVRAACAPDGMPSDR
jgi:multicomponent Na+:H+ antiporter subunit E